MGTPEAERQPPFSDEGASERPIVAFDFDGTLTTHDSFTAFLRWKAEPLPYLAGLLRLLPHILAYGVNHDRGRLKAAAAARFLGGLTAKDLAAQADAFAMERAQSMLRPDAVQGHGERGSAR